MKKIVMAGTALALVMAAGSALAANSLNSGTFGLNVPVITANSTTNNFISNPIISGRYFVANSMAVLAGFGFNSGGPSGASTTTFALQGGFRKYLKTDDLAPFVGGILQYESTSSNPASTALTVAAEGGAEYFLARQFSVEGKVAFGYQSNDNAGAKTTYFGTTTANLSVNFYF